MSTMIVDSDETNRDNFSLRGRKKPLPINAASDSFASAIRKFAGLHNEPAKAIRDHAAKLGRLRTVSAVLDWLDELARAFDMQLHGIWELPADFVRQLDRWHPEENMFLHRQVPPAFWPDYAAQYRIHGPSVMTYMLRRCSLPFTFQEAERDAKRLRQRNTYVFNLFRTYGFADGLYCPARKWAACFVATKLLVVSSTDRLFIHSEAMRAFGQIEKIIPMVKRARKINSGPSPRELEALQALAVHGTNAKAGIALNITASAIEKHVKSARRKLNIETNLQLALWAQREGKIEY